MREIKNMSVLVTGGGSGIGEGTARHFAGAGAKVTISGRRPGKIHEVANSIGPLCRAVVGDVTVQKDREAMLAAAVEHGGKLDVLVNNAANMYRQAIGEYTEEFLKDAFNTNVISAMLLSSMAMPHLEKTQGAIVFLGSILNRRAFPGKSPYAATKAAIEGLTRVMAAELGPRQVRCACVLPGSVPTEINQRANVLTLEQSAARHAEMASNSALGRVGTVAEIAEAIEFLVRSEWITGVSLEVDGGLGLGVSNFKSGPEPGV